MVAFSISNEKSVQQAAGHSFFFSIGLLENRQIPLFAPTQNEAVILKLDGQPDVAAVDCIFGTPAVTHINKGVLLAGNGQDIGALRAIGGFALGIDTRIAQLGPRTPDGGGYGRTSGIGTPTRATRGHEVVEAVLLEDGRGLHATTYKGARIFTAEIEVVVGQLIDVDHAVRLRRADVIASAIVIDVEGHIA